MNGFYSCQSRFTLCMYETIRLMGNGCYYLQSFHTSPQGVDTDHLSSPPPSPTYIPAHLSSVHPPRVMCLVHILLTNRQKFKLAHARNGPNCGFVHTHTHILNSQKLCFTSILLLGQLAITKHIFLFRNNKGIFRLIFYIGDL